MEPKIRIKGFDKDWESIALGEIASFSKGRGYSKADLRSQGNPIILYGRMYTKYSPIIEDVDTYAIPQEGSVYSKGNEVIIPGSGETPDDISIASAVLTPGIIFGGDLNILSFDESKHNPAFMAIAITNSKTHKELSSYAQGKTIVHLHNKDIAKGQIMFPELNEQASIVEFVKSIDLFVKSSTDELESFKQIKSASLQVMFPQKGGSVPKVRFGGFNGDWRITTLGRLASIIKGEQLNKSDQTSIGEYYVLNGGIGISGYTDMYNTENNTISISEGGNSCGYVNFNYERFWSGGHNYTLQNVQISNEYLYSYLKMSEKEIMKKRVGSGLPNIQKSALVDFPVYYPEDSEEQKRIGSFFLNLDQQIDLRAKRIEKLHQIKIACYNQMFV